MHAFLNFFIKIVSEVSHEFKIKIYLNKWLITIPYVDSKPHI